ncbi:hypothetical protein IAT40_003153 [Kwoniella sp. CBS 6097]
MAPPPPFPSLKPKPDLPLTTILPSQIYIVDDFLSQAELKAVRSWTEGVIMEDPKKPGKGEAERTARRGALDSPDIAAILLRMLEPYLPRLSPRYTASSAALSPNIRVYHYPAGTYFRSHYDSPTLDARTRRLSCWTVLVYLSSDVKGGGTSFYTGTHDTGGSTKKKGKKNGKDASIGTGGGGKVTVEPKAGRLLFHWHGMSGGGCLRHEGDEVISGDKWVLRTDVLA